jgi:hypothetical protein
MRKPSAGVANVVLERRQRVPDHATAAGPQQHDVLATREGDGLAARGRAKLAPRLFREVELINGERQEQIQSIDRSTAQRGFETAASRTSEAATEQLGGFASAVSSGIPRRRGRVGKRAPN